MYKDEIKNSILTQVTEYQMDKFENGKNGILPGFNIKLFANYTEDVKLSKNYGQIKLKKGTKMYFLIDEVCEDTLYLAIIDAYTSVVIYSKLINIFSTTEDDIIEISDDINDSIDSYMTMFTVFSKKEVKSKKKKKKKRKK